MFLTKPDQKWTSKTFVCARSASKESSQNYFRVACYRNVKLNPHVASKVSMSIHLRFIKGLLEVNHLAGMPQRACALLGHLKASDHALLVVDCPDPAQWRLLSSHPAMKQLQSASRSASVPNNLHACPWL